MSNGDQKAKNPFIIWQIIYQDISQIMASCGVVTISTARHSLQATTALLHCNGALYTV